MTPRPRLAECRACRLPIRFVKLGNGKALPVNPQPNPAGNVACKTIAGQLHGRVVGPRSRPPMAGEEVYLAHFATCTHYTRPTKPRPPDPEPLF